LKKLKLFDQGSVSLLKIKMKFKYFLSLWKSHFQTLCYTFW
jgi:hypothetical protein